MTTRFIVLGTAGHIDHGMTTLVRAEKDLYFHRAALDDLAGRLTAFLRERGQITPTEYKALTGGFRKYTVPLMEHFDEQKLRIRVGNVRRRR